MTALTFAELSLALRCRCKAFLAGESGCYGLTCAAQIPIGDSWCWNHQRAYLAPRSTPAQKFREAAE